MAGLTCYGAQGIVGPHLTPPLSHPLCIMYCMYRHLQVLIKAALINIYHGLNYKV